MVALACVVVSTLLLVPLQLLAMKTRLWSEWRVLRLWHWVNCRALGFRIHQKGELTDKRPLVTPFRGSVMWARRLRQLAPSARRSLPRRRPPRNDHHCLFLSLHGFPRNLP